MHAIPVNQIILNKNDIHIWKFDISAVGEELSGYQALLSVAEKERASRFKFNADREHFSWGRIQLKRLLSAYLDESPEIILLRSTSEGKPILGKKEHQHIQFNISHSGNLIILGFSRSPIGVDVEETSIQVDINKVSRNYFSTGENKMIEMVSEEDRKNKFFEIWTKKEAVIKGVGKGLGIPLKNFSVIGESGHLEWKPGKNAAFSEWYVHAVEVIPSYKAAFATPIKNFEVTCFSINELV